MASKTRGLVELRFSDGEVVSIWDAFTMRESFLDPLGSYSFTVTPIRRQVKFYQDRLKRGHLVGIQINSKPVATPMITSIQRTVSQDGVTFQFECKSVLANAYEGSVDPKLHKKVKGDVLVKDIILAALKPYGFVELTGDATISVHAKTGKRFLPATIPEEVDLGALKDKDIEAQHGETAYSFIARILNRLGAAMHVDHEGKILIQQPLYSQAPLYTLSEGRTAFPGSDRMLSPINVMETLDGQYSEVVVEGQAPYDKDKKRTETPLARVSVQRLVRHPAAPFQKAPSFEIAAGLHSFTAQEQLQYRPNFRLDKSCYDVLRCRNMAGLVIGSRQHDGFKIGCTVDGLVSNSGAVWTHNTVARVVIETLEFDEEMWILERTFHADRASGERTDLTLIPKFSLVLQ